MSKLHILLVEDNEDDRFLATRTIRKLPVPVHLEIARDGAEALSRLEGDLPSLVLLDLQLPKVTGIEVLERLRTLPGTRELPVLVLSASEHPEDMARCRELGISAYLNKPLDPKELWEVITTIHPNFTLPPSTSSGTL